MNFKKIISIVLALAMVCSMSVIAFAEKQEWVGSGVYDLKVSDNTSFVTVTPQKADKTAPSTEKVGGTDLYLNTERFAVSIPAANTTAGKYYMIFVLKSDAGTTYPTVDNIVYINQVTAGSTGVEFNAFPSALTDGAYGIYVSTNDTTSGKLTGYTKVASFSYYEPYVLGDVNDDKSILPDDAVMVLEHYVNLRTLAGSQFLAADTNKDGSILPDDAVLILEHYVGLRVLGE